MRFAVAAWVFSVLARFALPCEAAVHHHSSHRVAFAQVSAERGSPDLRQWMSGPIIVGRVHHAATIRRFAHSVLSRASAIAQRLTKSALRFLGVPYVFGGTSSAGFDCSGYVQRVFGMLGIHIPRTADAQYYAGSGVRKLRAGDLVFFETYESGPSHVGIYLGHGRFVHASTSHGVIVSSLSDPYWANRYIGAKNLSGHPL